jgi:hypothetical protein
MRERDYHRAVAKVARANAKIDLNARKLRAEQFRQAMKMFNTEYKRQRLAGITKLPFAVATKRFKELIIKRGGGILGGDIAGVIKEALS